MGIRESIVVGALRVPVSARRTCGPLLTGAVLLLWQSALYAGGHCHSCCNPCPTLTGESFGYYPTQWRPWPIGIPSAKPPAEAPLPRSMPKGSEKNEPIPSPMKDKSIEPDDLGVWKQSSPYSPTPIARRHAY